MEIKLPSDFKEFLNLLNNHRVEYLLIGGYARVRVNIIGLAHLKQNKQASGRFKDLADLENLP